MPVLCSDESIEYIEQKVQQQLENIQSESKIVFPFTVENLFYSSKEEKNQLRAYIRPNKTTKQYINSILPSVFYTTFFSSKKRAKGSGVDDEQPASYPFNQLTDKQLGQRIASQYKNTTLCELNKQSVVYLLNRVYKVEECHPRATAISTTPEVEAITHAMDALIFLLARVLKRREEYAKLAKLFIEDYDGKTLAKVIDDMGMSSTLPIGHRMRSVLGQHIKVLLCIKHGMTDSNFNLVYCKKVPVSHSKHLCLLYRAEDLPVVEKAVRNAVHDMAQATMLRNDDKPADLEPRSDPSSSNRKRVFSQVWFLSKTYT